MCDCFHVVLPTWPGAPGSASGGQLQQQDPGAETEEDYSVTEGPVGEIIRPRPQGSSPVYEYTVEGAGFGAQESNQGRRSSSGRRRSWWKRDSGESTAFSSMSHPETMQETTEVTLKTEVEAGASGYTVTGGGDQGIFVKQVLKDSSAAKLFSLREGDQLLSATIFFDHMKYEDALKILQYSEPYKVQFRIKRKLSASKGEESAVPHSQQGLKSQEKQDKDTADGYMETPTKILEVDGDRERLISKSRDGRQRRPQDRLSWPKFQALGSKRGTGPRRSHSSSEASEQRDTHDVSPTSTDTEAQLTADSQEQKSGTRRRRRRFLNLRFGMSSGQGANITEQTGREPQDRQDHARLLEESQLEEDKTQASGFMSALTTQMPAKPSHSNLEKEGPGEMVVKTDRHQRKKKQLAKQDKEKTLSQHRAEPAPGRSWDDEWEVVESLEIGIARLSLQDKPDQGNTQVALCDAKAPETGFSKKKTKETKKGTKEGVVGEKGWRETGDRDRKDRQVPAESQGRTGHATDKGGKDGTAGWESEQEKKGTEQVTQMGQIKVKMPKFRIPSFGWSPTKEAVTVKRERKEVSTEDNETLDEEKQKEETEKKERECKKDRHTSEKMESRQRAQAMHIEEDIADNGGECSEKQISFKTTKLKVPSFGESLPGQPGAQASMLVPAPKVETEVTLPSMKGELRTPDIGIQLQSPDQKFKVTQIDVKQEEGQLPDGNLPAQDVADSGLKSDLPKVEIPRLTITKGDTKGPRVDVKSPKPEERSADMKVSLPGMKVDIQATGAKRQEDLPHAEKDMGTKDSKFKMPKFKMPSFGVSATGKPSMEATMEVPAPNMETDVTLLSMQGDVKKPDLSMQLPSSNLEVKAGLVDVKLPEGQLPEGQQATQDADVDSLKGLMPKVETSSFKIPKVDMKGPKLDVKSPKSEVKIQDLEVSLPSIEVDVRAPGAKLDWDQAMVDKDRAAKESKFKMPTFKMPSFRVSTTGKPSMEATMEVTPPKMEADVALPSIQGGIKTPDLSIQQEASNLEVKDGQVDVKMADVQLPEGEQATQGAAGSGLKGHLPKVQMPSFKIPKVDLKGPHVDLKDPTVEVKCPKAEIRGPDIEVSIPGVKVDIQAPGTKLQEDLPHAEKDVVTKDSKFKMPKFKMPTFGVSTTGKPSMEATMEVAAPKIEADISLPSVQSDFKTPDLSIQQEASNLEVKAGQVDVKMADVQLPEGEQATQGAAGAGLKGHLPKMQMPSFKIPKVDLKGPHVDLKDPTVDGKSPKAEVRSPDIEVSLPGVKVDIQAPGAKLQEDLPHAEKDVATKESKFKMPKFKMPSFGVSATSKPSMEATTQMAATKMEADVSLSSMQGDIQEPDLSIQQGSFNLEVKAAQVDVKLPEGQLPDGEHIIHDADGAGMKSHLPKVQMPSFKIPKVDLRGSYVDMRDPRVEVMGPTVDAKGRAMDVKSPKAEIRGPDIEVSLPCETLDIEAPGAKLQGDLPHAEKDVSTKDSKFKMPKFKMPSFGVSTTGKPFMEATMEVAAPNMEADMSLPSMQSELKTPDLSIQLPSTNLEVKAGKVDAKVQEGQVPEGDKVPQDSDGAGMKGYLPKVQMPSIKVPKEDLMRPTMDVKCPKAEVRGPDMKVSLPGMKVDIQAPGAKRQEDLPHAEKDVSTKDSKFKMPKFKMPSFSMSATVKPSMEATMEVSDPKMEADMALPSIQGDVETTDLSIHQPSSKLEVKSCQVDVKMADAQLPEREQATQGAARAVLTGHLPKVQMPSFKMPKVDLKGPHVDLKDPTMEVKGTTVDIKGPRVDVKSPKAEVRGPEIEVSLADVKTDIQAQGAKLEEDLPHAEKDVSTKDSKFKMPKFKMPSFGVSATGKPSMEATMEVTPPKMEADMSLPSMQGDVKTPDLSIHPPSSNLEVKSGQVDVKMADVQLPEGEQVTQDAAGSGLIGHPLKVKMPSFKIPKVDLKGPHVDLKGPPVDVKSSSVDAKSPKAEVRSPDIEASLPYMKVDIHTPGTKLHEDLPHAEKDVASNESKIKMPQFKMPSFGVSTTGKPCMEATMVVAAPNMEADMSMPSMQSELKIPDLSIQLPSSNLEVKSGQVDVKVPEGQVPEGEQIVQGADGASLKGHLPKVQMPSFKMPKVDLKGPHVDMRDPKVDVKSPKTEIRGPDIEVSLPGLKVDIQEPGAKLQEDLPHAEKDVLNKDSKFKMPKFKIPSFGVSTTGKPSMVATMEVASPKMGADMSLPSMQGEQKTPDLSIQLPSTNLEVKAGQVDVKVPEGQVPEGEEVIQDSDEASMKGHLTTVQMPSLKMPKVDLKDPTVYVKCPKAEVRGPDMEVSLPGMKVDIQAPGAKLQEDLPHAEKDVSTKDSKFKMPKFKVPSFSVSATGKPSMEATMEVAPPKMEEDVALPSMQADIKKPDLSIHLPSSNLEVKSCQVDVKMGDVKLLEGEQATQGAAGADLKSHLPKVQMPSFKIPKVDLKGPHVDLKSPKAEVRGPDIDVSLPGMKVDIQDAGSKIQEGLSHPVKDLATKESKFKMPKFKMPSFGVSTTDKPSIEATIEMAATKMEADVSLPSMQGDVQEVDLSIQQASSNLEVKAAQVDVKLPEGEQVLHDADGAGMKSHLPKVQMPSFKIPKVDLKGPHVDLRDSTVDVKSPKAEIKGPDIEVSLPGMKVDIQAPGGKLQEDLPHAEKDVSTKDSKFKTPKFKMPSFGVSATGEPSMEATIEVAAPKMRADMSLPSMQSELKTPDLSIQLPSTNLEVKAGKLDAKVQEGQVPEGDKVLQDSDGASMKGHLPKVQISGFKMPTVDLKGPHVYLKDPTMDIKGTTVDIKCSRVDVKSPKAEVRGPDIEVSLPGMKTDIQAQGAKLEEDLPHAEKNVATKESKFKMPKFKKPSFGVSATGEPSMEAAMEVASPKMEADISLPSLQSELKISDLSIQLPSTNLEVKSGQVDVKVPEVQVPEGEQIIHDAAGADVKGHLPKVQMPSFTMPNVDLKGPHVDMRDPTVDVKSPKAEIRGPDIEVSLPGLKIDIQESGSKLQEDLPHAEKDVATKESKFKMPKFKKPSFGVSATGEPSLEAAMEVASPKMAADMSMPSMQSERNTPDLSIQLPSTILEFKAGQVDVKVLDGHLPEGQQVVQVADGTSMKGHLPKVQMSSFKMPQVDLKGPTVDMKCPKAEIRGPDMEVSLPGMKVEIQAPGTKLQEDLPHAEKDVSTKDSKFKMPKFKVPSFSVSATGKPSMEATMEVAAPNMEADMSLPSMQSELKIPDLSIQLPSSNLEVKSGQVDVKLTEGQLPEGEQATQDAAGASLKGLMPKVETPSFKIPKVDMKDPHVDLKSPQSDVKIHDLELSLPSVEVDIQAPGAKCDGDQVIVDKDMTAKDNKFKMPTFKMPSFGVSASSKPSMEATMEVSVPNMGADLSLSSMQGDVKTSDVSIHLPSSNLEVETGQVELTLPEGQLPEGEQALQDADGAGMKGHLPTVQMPSFKMPKVDLRCPHADLKSPKVAMKSTKSEVKIQDLAVSLPSVEIDIQASGAKLDGDQAMVDNDRATIDSKFKMPKFKVPSFSVSATGKPSMEATMEVAPPKMEEDVALPSMQADIKKPDLSIHLPSSNLEVKSCQVDVKMGDVKLLEGEQATQGAAGADLKSHLPKVQMPSFKIPKVDLKGPHVDLKSPKAEVRGPDIDVSLPGMKVDIQAAGSNLQEGLSHPVKDLATKESKFKMHKFKMPSFGVSATDKPSTEATIEMAATKMEADMSLPSMQGDVQEVDLSIQQASSNLEVKAAQVDVKLPEGEQVLHDDDGAGMKSHLPKVQMPSFKIPKVDLKGPHVDLRDPTVEVKSPKAEIKGPDMEVSLPGVNLNIQAPGGKLQEDLPHAEKDVSAKDSKFKMPKFKMPTFGVSTTGKPSMEATMEVIVPRMEADVSMPSLQGVIKTPDLSIQLPASKQVVKPGQVDVKMADVQLPEGEQATQGAAGSGLKGHLPKVETPSFKIPKVDLEGPHVDLKGPKLDLKSPKCEVKIQDLEASLPSIEVDVQALGAKMNADQTMSDKDRATKDSKFKMPKFKMPSFGVSATGKPSMEATMEVTPPKMEADVSMPSMQADVKTPDLSIQLPSSNLEVKSCQVDVQLADIQLPEGEQATQGAAGAGLKGHLPKVEMPSFKIPKVDLKEPHVDLKDPTVDVKSPKAEVRGPEIEVSLPGVKVDIQAPGAKLQEDLPHAEKNVSTKDSKFKMPKFKMPSFGVSTTGKPSMEATMEVAAPSTEADMSLPSMQSELKIPDLSIQLPSSNLEVKAGKVDVKLPEGQLPKGEQATQDAAGASLKGLMPKVRTPSLKIPKVDLKGPHVDLKSPQSDVKIHDIEVSLPSVDVDVQAPGAKRDGDQVIVDKDMTAKDSKFKMPTFKMPSFGVSAISKPTMDATMEVTIPKIGADMSLSSMQGDVKTSDVSIHLPSYNLELKTGQVDFTLPEDQLPEGEQVLQDADGAGMKSHLPNVQMPSFKMPKVDLKSPKSELKTQDFEVHLPSVEVDVQASGAKLDGDQAIVDKDMAPKDSKFKMPSFGVSATGKPSMEATMEVSVPKVEADVSLPLTQGDIKTSDLSIHLPSSNLEVKSGLIDVKMADVQLPEGEQATQGAAGAILKGNLPKVQMPSFKMPKVVLKDTTLDVKSPKVETVDPDVEASPPSMEVDIHAPCAKVQGHLVQGTKDVSSKDSKFKMPKFKMPSFGMSATGKPSLEASLEVAAPKMEAGMSYPCHHGDLVTPDLSIQLPSTHLEVKASQVDMKLLEGQLEGEVPAQAGQGSGVKAHLPQVQMPSLKMPKVDLKGPTDGVKIPKDVVSGPDVELPLSSVQVNIQAQPSLDVSMVEEPPVSHVSGESSIESANTPPLDGSDREGEGSSFKLPHIKLPPFTLSPKKKAESAGDSESPQVDPIHSSDFSVVEMDPQIGTCASPAESHQHVSIEKEAEKGRSRKLSFSVPRLALPKIKGSKGRAGVSEGEVKPSLTGTTAGGNLVVIQTTVSDTHVGGTRSKDVATEPCIGSPSMTAEVTGCKTDLVPLEDALDIRGDSKSRMFVGVSASQPFGELAAPVTGDLQPSCRQRHHAPTMESPEMDHTAKESSRYSHERRFKMPKFRVPGFRRSSSKEQDGAGEQEATQTSDAGIALEAEVAAATVWLSDVPESKLEAHVSLGSPEEGISVETPKSLTYADVVKRDLHGTGFRLHGSTVGMSQAHLSTHELVNHPAKDSSFEMSSVRVSELQLPPEGTGKQQHPGSGGNILAEVEAGAGSWPSQPQGPLRLKASITDMPSQVSVVSTSHLWEDSVLTVTFPKLKVPKFSFQASSSAADVFFPVVREVQCAEASISSAMHKDGPGLWEASILKTGAEDPRGPPVSLEQSLEPSPISKVRVHIQGSQGESQEVAICSRVEREGSDSSACGAFSTQIVRESEIPVSTIQTPSYGFSLLKVKLPEPPVQASMHTVAPDCQAQEVSAGGAPQAAAGRHFIPADSGEPFEMISSSVGMPPLSFTPEVPPGPQLTGSSSDEEPAEILEFPEDSQEVKTPEMATKQKPEGKKASLLWSWLPSIGFSSVEEMAADSQDATQRPAPVHVQPAARLDPELPRKQEKAGWFRFPKLGFSSSPTKKSRSTEGGDGQVEQKSQEESLTFFDARESFSPEEEEAEPEVTSARPGSKAMVASSARTELVLLEQARDTGDKSIPRPVAK